MLDTSTLTIEQLQEKVKELEELVSSFIEAGNQLENNILALELDKSLLLSNIKSYQYQLDEENAAKIAFRKEKEDFWKAQKQVSKINEEQLEIFHRKNWELLGVKNQASRVLEGNNLERNQLMNEIDDLKEKIDILNYELTRTKIDLELTEKNLKDIRQLNFESKLKLQGLLFLDTLRTFLPKTYGKVLTGIESSIFISGLTNYPTIEKTGWIFLAIFLILSVLHTSYKSIKFIWFKGIYVYRRLKGVKTDLEDLKDKELKAWKDKWNVVEDYSKSNLNKDGVVLDINPNENKDIINK